MQTRESIPDAPISNLYIRINYVANISWDSKLYLAIAVPKMYICFGKIIINDNAIIIYDESFLSSQALYIIMSSAFL